MPVDIRDEAVGGGDQRRSISSSALVARPARIAPRIARRPAGELAGWPGRDLDDALRPQRGDRLAGRGPAQRELLGQVAFGHQLVAGLQLGDSVTWWSDH